MQAALQREDRQRAGKKKGKKKAAKRKTLQSKKVIKSERRWLKCAPAVSGASSSSSAEGAQEAQAPAAPKGRVGITVTARMRSAAGNRTVKRRIVMRTYKKGERRR